MSEENWRRAEGDNFYHNLYCPSCGVLKTLSRHIQGCFAQTACIGWDEFIRPMAKSLAELSPERLEELQKDMGIVEYVTPFGVLKIIPPKLFREEPK